MIFLQDNPARSFISFGFIPVLSFCIDIFVKCKANFNQDLKKTIKLSDIETNAPPASFRRY